MKVYSSASRTNMVLVLLFLTISVAAQDLDKINSLHKELATSKKEARFDLLNKIAWEYRSSFPDSAILYAKQALDLAKALELDHGTATSLNYLGLANYYKGNLVGAYEYYQLAEQEATKTSDIVELGYAQNNIGRLFSEQGMLTESYPYFVKAEANFRSRGDSSGVAYVYQSFASLYKTEKDFLRSEQRYQDALRIRKHLGNTRDIMSAMMLLGKMYMEVKRYDDALLYFQKADSAGQMIHDNLGLAEIKVLLAEYYLGIKETAKAKKLCEEGLAFILNFKNVALVPRAYNVLGQIHFREKDYAVAKKYFTIALSVSQYMRDLDLSMNSHYYLWKISEYTHDREDELYHSNQYLVLKDSVNDIHVSEKIAKFQFQNEIERKRAENENLKEIQSRNETIIHHQDQQRAVLALLAFMVSILLYIQWRNARRRKGANVALSQQNARIEQMNTTLTDLVEETSERNTTLQLHLTTLVEFSKSKAVNFGTIEEASREIARITAQSLEVSRISVWSYDRERRTITSTACYNLATGAFLDDMTLDLRMFPEYELALTTLKIIEAPDARTNPLTREFKDSYLLPLDIHSMLDITITRDGELGGLICCEQQGAPREWKSEDIIFLTSVADVISLAYRTVQRREYEKKLKQQSKEITRMNEMLEQRVKERTEELEDRNNQLTEYAFINSHLLRSPVSKIMGLINLMEVDKTADPQEMVNLLRRSCDELDTVVKKITIALDGGDQLDRNTFKK
ncbi:MAG: GAF domain-containing protein [Bacteroidota bacterium]